MLAERVRYISMIVNMFTFIKEVLNFFILLVNQ